MGSRLTQEQVDDLRGESRWPPALALCTAIAIPLLLPDRFSLVSKWIDAGGPAARAHRTPKYPQLAFPGHMNPTLAPPGWRPLFLDYLYLGLTNATAFSPTDVMPLRHWAKLTMGVQALISLIILGLVVARAVNILT
jgi:hypothetical protein